MYKIIDGEVIELTGDDLAAEQARIVAEVAAAAAISYIEARLTAYGKLGDQFDMVYRDIKNECLDQTGEFFTFIDNVKTTIPKPE